MHLPSPALHTDLYQLTMARGYLDAGLAERRAVFHLFFRKLPFRGGFAVACGLGPVLDFLERFRFGAEDLDYLASVQARDRPLFSREFLAQLGELRLAVDVDAVPEGSLVFPHEPLLRVDGPLLQVQLLETALLNLMNFQTLVATKAARVCLAAAGRPVLEFGLRRAQGPDGALSATRAAYVGGCSSSSNVLAGKLLGIPVKGTHAHSWVMCFESELEAFRQYAAAMPDNSIFLVDTYDTAQGVENAIRVGHELRQRGHELAGVRLDSGDLCALSQLARKRLNEAGFPDAQVVASNDLDEQSIRELLARGAQIDVFGVGTNLSTAADQPALGGVYKLGAIADASGKLEPRIKLSEISAKVSTPGCVGVVRYSDARGAPVGDLLLNELGDPEPLRRAARGERLEARGIDGTSPFALPENAVTCRPLLVPALRAGVRVQQPEPLSMLRERCLAELAALPESLREPQPSQEYPVGLEAGLAALKTSLVNEARKESAK